ncbi:hypothetical protein Rt10032_c11g4514 [Rhodotorula toruloides]|uniref:CBM20 domain-containing protein n=1 Tax=Rhodotorula toruloides TaxID=5286 RepID=A0A511KJD2_RHOTO|nr:hypothetical protein Rt10032_c11g4514 [Rhodotorula toruloides]
MANSVALCSFLLLLGGGAYLAHLDEQQAAAVPAPKNGTSKVVSDLFSTIQHGSRPTGRVPLPNLLSPGIPRSLIPSVHLSETEKVRFQRVGTASISLASLGYLLLIGQWTSRASASVRVARELQPEQEMVWTSRIEREIDKEVEAARKEMVVRDDGQLELMEQEIRERPRYVEREANPLNYLLFDWVWASGGRPDRNPGICPGSCMRRRSQNVVLVGSSQELGCWEPAKGLHLTQRGPGGAFSASLTLPRGYCVECKLVVHSPQGTLWERQGKGNRMWMGTEAVTVWEWEE